MMEYNRPAVALMAGHHHFCYVTIGFNLQAQYHESSVRGNNERVHRVPLIVQGLQIKQFVGYEAVHPFSPRMSHWG
jgi:hypothetical protein